MIFFLLLYESLRKWSQLPIPNQKYSFINFNLEYCTNIKLLYLNLHMNLPQNHNELTIDNFEEEELKLQQSIDELNKKFGKFKNVGGIPGDQENFTPPPL